MRYDIKPVWDKKRETAAMNLVGEKAFPFRLKDIEGKSCSLEDYSGTWLLLVFHRHLG